MLKIIIIFFTYIATLVNVKPSKNLCSLMCGTLENLACLQKETPKFRENEQV